MGDWKLVQNGEVVKQDFGFWILDFGLLHLPTFKHRPVRGHNMLGVAPIYESLRLSASNEAFQIPTIYSRYDMDLEAF